MDEYTADWINRWIFQICKTICTVLPSSNERIRIASLDLAIKRLPTGFVSEQIDVAKTFESYIRKGE
jgi:hypothetical protein